MMIPYPEDWALVFCNKYKIENWQLIAHGLSTFEKLTKENKKRIIDMILEQDMQEEAKKELLDLLKNL